MPYLLFFLIVLAGCNYSESKEAVVCDDFMGSVGVINVTVNGAAVSVDWENDLTAIADSLSVSVTGPTSPAAVNSKPAAFTLTTGSWTATVTYAKEGCASISGTQTFTVDTSVDCTAWNAMTVGTVTATVVGTAGVSVDWTGSNVTGQTSFRVQLTGGGSTPAFVQNTKPATFSELLVGNYTATARYLKTGCTDRTASGTFSISASLSGNLYPMFNSRCGGCHSSGHSSGFEVGANAGALRTALLAPNVETCSTAPTNPGARVTAGNSAQSFMYRRVTGTDCGTRMPTSGSLTSGELQTLSQWIDGGALNN